MVFPLASIANEIPAEKTLEAIEASKKDAQAAGPRVAPPTGKKIGLIHMSATSESATRFLDELKEAAGLFGWEVVVCDFNFDYSKIQMCSTTILAQKPDAIIGGAMKVISVIEDEEVIKKILKHLGLWEVKARPPPKTRTDPTKTDTFIDDSFSQLPVSDEWLYVDPEPAL